jgi:3-oxoacyl-[acyl-carrier protein] reductase
MSTAPKAMPIYPGLIGKVAVVTGASSGIGAETARYFAANMVTVVVNSRNRDKLNKVAAGAQVGVITC